MIFGIVSMVKWNIHIYIYTWIEHCQFNNRYNTQKGQIHKNWVAAVSRWMFLFHLSSFYFEIMSLNFKCLSPFAHPFKWTNDKKQLVFSSLRQINSDSNAAKAAEIFNSSGWRLHVMYRLVQGQFFEKLDRHQSGFLTWKVRLERGSYWNRNAKWPQGYMHRWLVMI